MPSCGARRSGGMVSVALRSIARITHALPIPTRVMIHLCSTIPPLRVAVGDMIGELRLVFDASTSPIRVDKRGCSLEMDVRGIGLVALSKQLISDCFQLLSCLVVPVCVLCCSVCCLSCLVSFTSIKMDLPWTFDELLSSELTRESNTTLNPLLVPLAQTPLLSPLLSAVQFTHLHINAFFN